MTKTTASGSSCASCSCACCGQSKKSGVRSPLDTRESYCGATTPVSAVSWPSDGPIDPASESPAIHSRSGAAVVSARRWTGFGRGLVLDVEFGGPSEAWTVEPAPGSSAAPVTTSTVVTMSASIRTDATDVAITRRRRCRARRAAARGDTAVFSGSAIRSSTSRERNGFAMVPGG